jgi:hypothetical protein
MESNIVYKEESYRIMGLALRFNFGHYPGVEYERIVL